MIALMLSMYKMGISEIKTEFDVTSKENFKYYFITNGITDEEIGIVGKKFIKSKQKDGLMAVFVY